MDDKLTETVTVTPRRTSGTTWARAQRRGMAATGREVPMVIRDLVVFAKTIARKRDIAGMTDAELIAAAHEYWDRAHGDD